VAAATAFAVSLPAFAEPSGQESREASIEEIVVYAHRTGSPQVDAYRAQIKLALDALLDGIERDEAQKASERTVWSQVRFGYDPARDRGPLIDENRQQVALSFVRPATVISAGF
jgi:hypothetical protein